MIRDATLQDLSALLDIGEAMADESPRFSRMRFSRDRLAETLKKLITEDWGFARVIDGPAGITGVMLAVIAPHWFSSDLQASDLALYVAPEARGTMAAARLIRDYTRWAWKHGAVLVQAGVTTGVHTEDTARLYERLGYRRCGVFLEA
jgi:GNAT superfamily N-acetyltransferase